MNGNPYKAFSLVELIVSVAIMVTMSTLLLWNYPDSLTKIKMINFLQSTALLLREAQIRGSAIDSSAGEYAGYGVYFNLASSSEVILFGDKVVPDNYVNGILLGDGLFATSTTDEIKTITTLPPGFVISKLCVASNGPFYCNSDTVPEIDDLTIAFVRPNPQPQIHVNGVLDMDPPLSITPAPYELDAPYTGVCIELSSPHAPAVGHVRSIRIEGAGFITTKAYGCQ